MCSHVLFSHRILMPCITASLQYTRVLTKKYHEVIDNSYTADSASDVEAHSTVGLPSELAMTRTLGGL